MANYPASLDTLTNPAASDVLTTPPHHTQHTDANDILEALETKVGTGASTPTTVGHALLVTAAGATAYGAPVVPEGRLYLGAGNYLSIPGMAPVSLSTNFMAATTIYYTPMLVPTPIIIDQLVCEVTTAGAAGVVNRMGLYVADINWVPGALVVDGGTVAADSTGVKTITLSPTISLSPGRYLLAIRSTGVPVVRGIIATTTSGFIDGTLGSSPLVSLLRKTSGTSPFADPGEQPSTALDSAGLKHTVFVHVLTP